MYKDDVLAQLCQRTSVSRELTETLIDEFLNIIMEAVAKGEKVKIYGFGSFEARYRAAREARNPQTNEPITLPATMIPTFAADKRFKAKLDDVF